MQSTNLRQSLSTGVGHTGAITTRIWRTTRVKATGIEKCRLFSRNNPPKKRRSLQKKNLSPKRWKWKTSQNWQEKQRKTQLKIRRSRSRKLSCRPRKTSSSISTFVISQWLTRRKTWSKIGLNLMIRRWLRSCLVLCRILSEATAAQLTCWYTDNVNLTIKAKLRCQITGFQKSQKLTLSTKQNV